MIVSSTPYRITLGGGGTDLPSFYEHHGGFVVALTIDKQIRIAVHRPVLDDVVRVHHARSEWADHPSSLRHDLAREALLTHDFDRRIAVHSFADLPGGAGLGSSSAYLVGLLLALRTLRDAPVEGAARAQIAGRQTEHPRVIQAKTLGALQRAVSVRQRDAIDMAETVRGVS